MSRTAELAISTAELLVRVAEADLAAATDPTFKDIAETELRRALALQDEVLETVAPAIEKRREDLNNRFWAVVRAARGEPGSDWMMRHRRWLPTDLKAEIVRRLGKAAYLSLPW
jgi:hypothetical protein